MDVDVCWYIGGRTAVCGGRYRYWRKGFQCYLELFDCDVTDAGYITCNVNTISCTASDSTFLRVIGKRRLFSF
ncbi:unnamed protein product, partial [Gongylonema pulchrum]